MVSACQFSMLDCVADSACGDVGVLQSEFCRNHVSG